MVLTTAAPEPAGRLSFKVEAAPPASAAGPTSRRRLGMQPSGTSEGSMAAGGGTTDAASACGVPAAPALRLRLPAGQQLSSVIWKDSLNRTVHVESGASLAAAAEAAAAAGADSWSTAAVALPALHPLEETSGDPAPGCSGSPACQQAQRRYTALVLAPDGRHSSVAVALAPATLLAQPLSLQYKHYERQQLTHEQDSLLLPNPGAGSLLGTTLFDGGSAALQLARAGSAVVSGSSLPDTRCSRQWSLSLLLRLSGDALRAAGQAQVGTGAGAAHSASTGLWHRGLPCRCAARSAPSALLTCLLGLLSPPSGRPDAVVHRRRLPLPQPGPLPAARHRHRPRGRLAGVGRVPAPPGPASLVHRRGASRGAGQVGIRAEEEQGEGGEGRYGSG